MKKNPVTRLLQLRLLAAIEQLRLEVARYAPGDKQRILDSITSALEDADYFAQQGEFQMGWTRIFLAEQQMVLLMNEDQRAIKADNLRIEARKLPGWRQEQIFHLLGHPDADPRTLRLWDKDRIIEAVKIRNDYYNTYHHRLLLRRANLDMVTIALVGGMALVLLLSLFAAPDRPPAFGALTIVYSILFGALGASFSMAYTISTTSLSLTIPDQLQGIYNIVIRLSIGAISGCVIVLLFHSGIFRGLLAGDMQDAHAFFLVLAFLGGFSERWVFNLVSGLVRQNDKGVEKKG